METEEQLETEEQPDTEEQLETEARALVGAALENARAALLSECEIKNIEWATCGEFTVELGKEQIIEYMGTWDLPPGWQLNVEFLEQTELEYRTEYNYKAMWAIPTRRRPIPKCTASVYFVFEISKIRPRALPVVVYFMVESNRWRHVPGKTRFREKWLRDVIESKAAIFDAVTF